MKKPLLTPHFELRLKRIYEAMEKDYDEVAGMLGLTCTGCPDNCCDSYFLHYTYLEWVYLWQGFQQLAEADRASICQKAEDYQKQAEAAQTVGKWPQIMCPLNENGRCVLYRHRLMVCRTHGVPARLRRPDGKELQFPGCFRCQEIVENQKTESVPSVDRTALLRQLVLLEKELLLHRRTPLPKIKMTIAEMLVKGPPARYW